MHLHLVYFKRFNKLLLVSNSENNRFVAHATLQVAYVFNVKKNIYIINWEFELLGEVVYGLLFFRENSLKTIVLKPGPARRVDPGPGQARRVDPGPGQPRPGTGPGLSKILPGSWPGETRVNPAETRPLFFFYTWTWNDVVLTF